MKKTFLLIVTFLFSYGCFAQQIERLSQKEISENETPRAVAYNFVKAIIDENYAKMYNLMTEEFRRDLESELESGVTLQTLFSSDNIHDIVEMRPVVKMGYEVVIYDSWVVNTDDFFGMYGKENPYKGLPAFSVSFNCADAYNNFYDGTYGDYDTSARVLLVKKNGVWRVFMFK